MSRQIKTPFKIGEVWMVKYDSVFSNANEAFTILNIKEHKYEIYDSTNFKFKSMYHLICEVFVDNQVRKLTVPEDGFSKLLNRGDLVKIC